MENYWAGCVNKKMRSGMCDIRLAADISGEQGSEL